MKPQTNSQINNSKLPANNQIKKKEKKKDKEDCRIF